MRQLGHVPALDGLRGVAILLVLAVHAGWLRGGALGVDLFFVLSGFLITCLLLNEWHRDGRVSLRGFYRRRALRLFPALFAMLVVYSGLLITGLVQSGEPIMAITTGALYVSNVVQASGGMFDDLGVRHLWSLSMEEQFYLAWPILLLGALQRRWRVSLIVTALLALIVLVWLRRVALLGGDPLHERLWLAPDAHSDPLLIGCLTAVVFASGWVSRLPGWAATMQVSILAVSLFAFWGDESLYVAGATVFAVSCASIMLAVATNPTWWFANVLSWRWLRGVGTISYGLYIWHLPLRSLLDPQAVAGIPVWVPASFAVALLSYRYVERPFLQARHARGRDRAQAGLAVPETA